MELEKLLVKIEADLSDLKRGLDKANNQVKSSSSKMSNSFKQMGDSLDRVGRRVIKFGGLLGGAFGVYQVAQVVSVGRQIEDLQVRLKALFGTAEEGSRAFDVMVKFASRVPFTLEDIQQASGNLAVVSKDANELAEILEITGNVAGATGLDFRQTAEQIQRSFAGGIASADVFRERGVRSMLGFQAGAEVSASQTIKAFKEKFGKGGEFGNVTDDLANTLTGTLSMLQDKLFQFRKAVSDEFTVVLKEQFKTLNDSLEDSERKIKEVGKTIGANLARALNAIVENINGLVLALETLGIFLTSAIGVTVFNFIKNLSRASKVAGVLVIAFQFVAEIVEKIADEFAKLNPKVKQSNDLMKFYETVQKGVNTALEEGAKRTEEQKSIFDKVIVTEGELKDITEKVGKTFEDAGEDISKAFGRSVVEGENFGDAMKNIFKDVASQIVATITQILIIEPMIKRLTDSLKEISGGGDLSVGGVVKKVGTAILGDTISGALGFANGGYVAPNRPAIVGERGAEMIVPRTASTVIPNNELGGSVVVNQSLNFSTGIVPTVRAEVLNMLPTIKQETINAVAETRSRGGSFARTFGA